MKFLIFKKIFYLFLQLSLVAELLHLAPEKDPWLHGRMVERRKEWVNKRVKNGMML